MSEYDENQVFDWDDEVEDDGSSKEFVTLEPGKYDFEVVGFERGHHEAKDGGKAPSCNKAIIQIKISTDDGDCFIKENFLLYKKMEWKISQFFRCIGMKKHGEKAVMKWDQAVGLTGKAQITKDKGNKDDVYFNHVKEWMEPEEGDEWN